MYTNYKLFKESLNVDINTKSEFEFNEGYYSLVIEKIITFLKNLISGKSILPIKLQIMEKIKHFMDMLDKVEYKRFATVIICIILASMTNNLLANTLDNNLHNIDTINAILGFIKKNESWLTDEYSKDAILTAKKALIDLRETDNNVDTVTKNELIQNIKKMIETLQSQFPDKYKELGEVGEYLKNK